MAKQSLRREEGHCQAEPLTHGTFDTCRPIPSMSAVRKTENNRRAIKMSEIVSSAEGESQQARAQQHKAGRCQREESIGNQIVIVHDEPAV